MSWSPGKPQPVFNLFPERAPALAWLWLASPCWPEMKGFILFIPKENQAPGGWLNPRDTKLWNRSPALPKEGEKEKKREKWKVKKEKVTASQVSLVWSHRLPSWWRTWASSIRNNDRKKKSQFKCCLENKFAFHIYELWLEIKSISTEGMYSVALVI